MLAGPSGLILGVDPGAHGALAILTADGAIVRVFDVPVVEIRVGKTKRTRIATGALAVELRGAGIDHAFVEFVGARSGQGTVSMFSFGKAAGIIEGMLAGLEIPVTFIPPGAWKKAMGVTADKGICRQRAMQIYPSRADLFRRVRDDGRAEATLLALYGVRTTQRVAA